MRKFDRKTGYEMWVSDFYIDGGYEWVVVDASGKLDSEIGSGCCEDWNDAVTKASKLYDQLLKGLG